MNCSSLIDLFSNLSFLRSDSPFLKTMILEEPGFMFSMLYFLDTHLPHQMPASHHYSFFQAPKYPSYGEYSWLEKNIIIPLSYNRFIHAVIFQNHQQIMRLLISLVKRAKPVNCFHSLFYDNCSMLNVLDEQILTECFSFNELVEILNYSLNSVNSSYGFISLISKLSPDFIQALFNEWHAHLNINPLIIMLERAKKGFDSEAIIFLKMLNEQYPLFITRNPVVPDLLFFLVPLTNYVSNFLQHHYSLFPAQVVQWLHYKDKQACNLLMRALKKSRIDMALIELLLRINQSNDLSLLDDKNIEGKSVMDLAQDINNLELLNMIAQYSRKRSLEPNPDEPAFKK
jgi:hypothetical protein